MTDEVRQTSDSGGNVMIRVGDYVYIEDSDEYGIVERVANALYTAGPKDVMVRLESDGEAYYYASQTVVVANTDRSPVCAAKALPFSNPQFSTSDSGATKQVKEARYDMIPADALRILAEHYGKGAEKYPPFDNGDGLGVLDNYRRGYHWSLSFAAMMRHAWAFWGGEDTDKETGSPHLAAVAWHALAMLHWSLNDDLKTKYDDRPRI